MVAWLPMDVHQEEIVDAEAEDLKWSTWWVGWRWGAQGAMFWWRFFDHGWMIQIRKKKVC